MTTKSRTRSRPGTAVAIGGPFVYGRSVDVARRRRRDLFDYDCFDLYAAKVLADPNMVVIGEPWAGKSTLVKCLLHHALVPAPIPAGRRRRWAAIVDPAGDYTALAATLRLHHIALYPGGAERLNPLDAGPGGSLVDPAEVAERRRAIVEALIATVLGRELIAAETAGILAALEALPTWREPVLRDVALLLATPSVPMAERAGCTVARFAGDLHEAQAALAGLIDGEMRGMFDGPSTVHADWAGPGVVVDLSRVPHDRLGRRVAALAATAWAQALTTTNDPAAPLRYQVLDQGYQLLVDPAGIAYLRKCWKWGRHHGVANIVIGQRLADLPPRWRRAGGAVNLLADVGTWVIMRERLDDEGLTGRALGLSDAEAAVLTYLNQGRALWKVAGRASVVQHVVGADQWVFCDSASALTV